MHKNMNK